jgi:hypothetical protein
MRPIAMTCPHCHTEKIAFEYCGRHLVETIATSKERGVDYAINRYNSFWACCLCKKIIVIEVKYNNFFPEEPFEHDFKIEDVFDVENIYPRYMDIKAPDYVPIDIANLFIEGKVLFYQQKWKYSGAAMRSALELSLKNLAVDVDYNNFISIPKRISLLLENNTINADLARWADIVRELGNEAVHGGTNPSKEDAEDILNFTKYFLIYVYTLPGMLARRKNPSTASK